VILHGCEVDKLLEAQAWSQDKNLSDLDYQFLAKAKNAIRVETRLEAERIKRKLQRDCYKNKTTKIQVISGAQSVWH